MSCNEKKDEEVGFAGCLVMVLSLPILIVGGSILNGYVLSVLWVWFVVPIFGLPALSIISAIGVSMVVSYLTYHDAGYKKEKTEADLTRSFAHMVAVMIIRPSFVLLFGWILNCFM